MSSLEGGALCLFLEEIYSVSVFVGLVAWSCWVSVGGVEFKTDVSPPPRIYGSCIRWMENEMVRTHVLMCF